MVLVVRIDARHPHDLAGLRRRGCWSCGNAQRPGSPAADRGSPAPLASLGLPGRLGGDRPGRHGWRPPTSLVALARRTRGTSAPRCPAWSAARSSARPSRSAGPPGSTATFDALDDQLDRPLERRHARPAGRALCASRLPWMAQLLRRPICSAWSPASSAVVVDRRFRPLAAIALASRPSSTRSSSTTAPYYHDYWNYWVAVADRARRRLGAHRLWSSLSRPGGAPVARRAGTVASRSVWSSCIRPLQTSPADKAQTCIDRRPPRRPTWSPPPASTPSASARWPTSAEPYRGRRTGSATTPDLAEQHQFDPAMFLALAAAHPDSPAPPGQLRCAPVPTGPVPGRGRRTGRSTPIPRVGTWPRPPTWPAIPAHAPRLSAQTALVVGRPADAMRCRADGSSPTLTRCRPGIRRHIGSETDIPVAWRPGCPHRSFNRSLPTGGSTHIMLRLQAPLPERYTDAPAPTLDALDRRRPRRALGDRVFILGHHYQRDEVMRWADARGDSFRLSVLAQEHPEADYIVFCGVHFMAESADVLTGDHQQVILPDLNAGCSMADMADIDQVDEAWDELGRGHRHRTARADHLHELLGRPEGVRRRPRRRRVHVDQRPGRARVGLPRSRRGRGRRPPGAVLPRSAPRPQHRLRDGLHRGRHAGLEPSLRARRADRRRGQAGHVPAVEGPLLGAPALHAPRTSRRSGPSTPTAS